MLGWEREVLEREKSKQLILVKASSHSKIEKKKAQPPIKLELLKMQLKQQIKQKIIGRT